MNLPNIFLIILIGFAGSALKKLVLPNPRKPAWLLGYNHFLTQKVPLTSTTTGLETLFYCTKSPTIVLKMPVRFICHVGCKTGSMGFLRGVLYISILYHFLSVTYAFGVSPYGDSVSRNTF